MNWNLLYSGYNNTPLLWSGSFEGIDQLELKPIPTPSISEKIPPSLRLGYLAEHFTFEYWRSHPDVNIVCHNVQIEGEEKTLGELDALIRHNGEVYHVEISYKFYLYDPNHGDTELEHWIGPNRKDTLISKLDRLKNHQLPLINAPETRSVLEEVVPKTDPIQSKVWIKAQLFLPLSTTISVAPLNNACIVGEYTDLNGLNQFKESKFFLPNKQMWFKVPYETVKWKKIDKIKDQIEPLLERQYSPMLWVKEPNGVLRKLFVVWW